jgi:hypothetical protein
MEWQSYCHKPIRLERAYLNALWIQILIRDTEDALTYIRKTGGINVIDLANINSVLYRHVLKKSQQLFEVLGRFDNLIFEDVI